MNAKELMIGDWVRINSDINPDDAYWMHDNMYPGEALKVEEILSNGINPDWYVGDINDYIPEDALMPIPLTPEILEKNFQEFLPGINLMYQLKGPYCAMNEDGQWVFGLVKVDGENSARYPLVKISFVHELQHALRLCEIEKEIEL